MRKFRGSGRYASTSDSLSSFTAFRDRRDRFRVDFRLEDEDNDEEEDDNDKEEEDEDEDDDDDDDDDDNEDEQGGVSSLAAVVLKR